MREARVCLYALEELGAKARERAIEANRFINTDLEWWDYLHTDFTARLCECGLSGKRFYWQLEGQGRGFWVEDLSIENSGLLLEKSGLASDERLLAEESIYLELRGSRQKSNHIGVHTGSQELDREASGTLGSYLMELLTGFLIDLDEEYAFLTSDEQIAETLNLNSHEFLLTGEEWPHKWG